LGAKNSGDAFIFQLQNRNVRLSTIKARRYIDTEDKISWSVRKPQVGYVIGTAPWVRGQSMQEISISHEE
jgi:hypothetical protein